MWRHTLSWLMKHRKMSIMVQILTSSTFDLCVTLRIQTGDSAHSTFYNDNLFLFSVLRYIQCSYTHNKYIMKKGITWLLVRQTWRSGAFLKSLSRLLISNLEECSLEADLCVGPQRYHRNANVRLDSTQPIMPKWIPVITSECWRLTRVCLEVNFMCFKWQFLL